MPSGSVRKRRDFILALICFSFVAALVVVDYFVCCGWVRFVGSFLLGSGGGGRNREELRIVARLVSNEL